MNRSDKFALATLLPLLALSALMEVVGDESGDKCWLLLAARTWLEGKPLYTGVVEINPPLIIWFYSIPVWLSQHAGILADYQILGLIGLILSALPIAISCWLIRQHPMFGMDGRRRVEFLLLLCGIFIFLTPQSFFFDREHIFYMFTFPYVLRFSPGLARQKIAPWLKIATGIAAAAGFCIKPHTLILFTAVQLLYLLRERSAAIVLSAENLIIYCGVAVYLSCIFHFAPEYVTIILPMAIATYGAFSRGGSILLNLPAAILCVAFTFADFRLRHASPYRRDVLYYIAIALALLLHALTSNGWDYTYHPLMCTLTLLAGLVLYEYRWLGQQAQPDEAQAQQSAFGVRGCAFCLAAQGIYMALTTFTSVDAAVIRMRCHHTPACMLQDPYSRYVHDHDIRSFGTVTQDFPKWVTLVQRTGAHWETRFNHLWMVPQLLKEGIVPTPAHAWIASYVAEALADDLTRRKPQIVFVDTGRQFSIYPKYIDLLQFLSEDPKFRAAWGSYRYETTIDECPRQKTLFKGACKYDIYSLIQP